MLLHGSDAFQHAGREITTSFAADALWFRPKRQNATTVRRIAFCMQAS